MRIRGFQSPLPLGFVPPCLPSPSSKPPTGAAWLHETRAHDAAVCLYAFDLIELDGNDLRPAPLEQRKGKLERLLTRSDGIRFSEHMEGDGATIFAHGCKLGLEGIVSKRRNLPYRSGRCKAWVKVKRRARPF